MNTEDSYLMAVQDPSSLTTQQLWREIAALKELVYNRFDAQTELVQQKFASLQMAVNKAEVDQDRRNILNNEFRGQLKDQAATFITREYLEQALKNVNDKLVMLQGFRSNLEGRMWAIGVGFAIVNLFIAGLTLYRSGAGVFFGAEHAP